MDDIPDIEVQSEGNEDRIRQLEDAVKILEHASKAQSNETISDGFPVRLSELANSLEALTGRAEAEKLLSVGMQRICPHFIHSIILVLGRNLTYPILLTFWTASISGVSMWNAAIAFEGKGVDKATAGVLTQVRHIAADCMLMSHRALGGISDRYNIDELSLMRFYTACGHKYAREAEKLDLAETCYSRAAEFADKVSSETELEGNDISTVARVLFDLSIGRAECAWEREDINEAENHCNEAHKYLGNLPGEHEFLASIEYNFGLFMYQLKNTTSALKWLKRSIETRGSEKNSFLDAPKQAATMRLTGICLLALNRYEDSWGMMKQAEDLHRDPTGAYLVLKLSIITRKSNAAQLLVETIRDENVNLEICSGCIALFKDANRASDAAAGLGEMFQRFRSDAEALVCTIGPRYFEILADLGRVDEAFKVLEICFDLIPRLTSDSDIDGNKTEGIARSHNIESLHLSRWAILLLAAGCEHADRNDYESAAILLGRALKLGRMSAAKRHKEIGPTDSDAPETSSVVLKNEPLICRVLAACALCSIEDASRFATQKLEIDNSIMKEEYITKQKRDKLLAMAVEHAERAKELDRGDCTPRLLLFRAHLVTGDFLTAADELRKASNEIRSVDAGALAEAACAARDAGSTKAVIAVLRCILNLDSTTLSANANKSPNSVPKGFYGTVFVSCIGLIRKEQNDEKTKAEEENNTAAVNIDDKKQRKELLEVMQAGVRGLQSLTAETAFDLENEQGESKLSYLTMVAWNEGKKAGENLEYAIWEGFFNVCYVLSQFLPSSAETVEMRRMCKVMSACAIVENPDSGDPDYERAKAQIEHAREENRTMKAFVDTNETNSVEELLLILEARCNLTSTDIIGIEKVVERAIQGPTHGSTYEQLAAVCHSWQTHSNRERDPQLRLQCVELQAVLLERAVEVRLREEEVDVAALAAVMREHIGIELSRSTSGRAFAAFRTAVDVVIERTSQFPEDERRWLVAIGWDRAQMMIQVGRRVEAKGWALWTRRLIENHAELSSYVPRIQTLLDTLGDIPDDIA